MILPTFFHSHPKLLGHLLHMIWSSHHAGTRITKAGLLLDLASTVPGAPGKFQRRAFLRSAEAGDNLWVLNLNVDGSPVFRYCENSHFSEAQAEMSLLWLSKDVEDE